MFRNSILFLALVFFSQLLTAQIRIVGANYDLGTSTIGVLRWDANTGAVLDSVPTPTQGIAVGSSVFDAFRGDYYFADFNGLNGIDFDSSTYTAYAGTQINTSAEIDMASGKIFGVRTNNVLDSNGIVTSWSMDMVEYHIANNTETVLGTFTGNQGVYLDASCFNSNLGIYYFIGVDSAQGQCLYSVNTRDSVFSFTLVPMNSPLMYVQTLEYDNEYNILYALMQDVSILGSEHFMIQKVNPATGALTMEVDFPQYSSYQVGSCSFHQATSSMVFVFPDSSGTVLRIYNTVSNTLTTGAMPTAFLNEYECDNSQYAASKYNPTAVKAPQASVSLALFPNPATTELRVALPDGVQQLLVIDASGRVTKMPALMDLNKIDVSPLAPGYYTLRSQLADGTWAQGKFIKL